MIGYLALFLGPQVMGFVSETFGLRAAFGVAAASLIAIPVLLLPRIRAATPVA